MQDFERDKGIPSARSGECQRAHSGVLICTHDDVIVYVVARCVERARCQVTWFGGAGCQVLIRLTLRGLVENSHQTTVGISGEYASLMMKHRY